MRSRPTEERPNPFKNVTGTTPTIAFPGPSIDWEHKNISELGDFECYTIIYFDVRWR